VYDWVSTELKWPPERTVLFGQSIGSGATCHLAASLNRKGVHLGAVILQSPYTSIKGSQLDFAGLYHFHRRHAAMLTANRRQLVCLSALSVRVAQTW
jgi:carboxylesterase type B